MSARGHDQQPSHRGTEPPIPAALPCRRRAEPLSEVDGVPYQRWMESPIRDGWSPPPEMDGVPHQRRTEHHVPEALPWPRPPVLLGPFPRLRP